MLSLDLAETTIIEIIATASIMAAIVPNSGTTNVPIISISSAPAGNSMVSVLCVDVLVSSKSTSSPSTHKYYRRTEGKSILSNRFLHVPFQIYSTSHRFRNN